jgi:carboxymethylenebutenolidase
MTDLTEFDVAVATADGTMPTFVARPTGSGPWPVLILYMDAPGIREELRDFTRRFAREGYYAMLPDMYYRLGHIRFNLAKRTENMTTMVHAARTSLTNAGVMNDTRGLLAAAAADRAASDGPLGCVGYCMSGAYAVTAAATFPDRMAAAVSQYGVEIVSAAPDSPHLLVDRIKGELYLAFAEHDEWVPPHVVPTLTRALDDAGASYNLKTYAGTHHGFSFPQRPAYSRDAAEAMWQIMFDLYARKLKGGAAA